MQKFMGDYMVKGLNVGVYGRYVIVTILNEDGDPKDISTSTARKFRIEKPDGTMVYWTAVYVTDGTDGKLQYLLIDGDINMAGEWRIQALVTYSGIVDPSTVGSFYVGESLIAET